MLQQAKTSSPEPAQRVQVSLQKNSAGDSVTIEVESHDPVLGWYTSGSLKLPLAQLPILQQAIDEMQRCRNDDEYGQIIPFPGSLAA